MQGVIKNKHSIHNILKKLEDFVKKFESPVVTREAEKSKDPFRILIATILSLRTKDKTTEGAAMRLFNIADNPYGILKLSSEEIEKIIYPVGFYKRKARLIIDISKEILEKYNGKVPSNLDSLLSITGVGRKTANLVLIEGFGQEGICVDTHVHRIANRLGYVRTKTPQQTEFSLREKLPREYWMKINYILVTFGQNLCFPLKPKCGQCPVNEMCDFFSKRRIK